jgi:hypothetical protein
MKLDADVEALCSSRAVVDYPTSILSEFRGKLAVAVPLGKDAPPPTAFVQWSAFLLVAENLVHDVTLCSSLRMPVIATRTYIAEVFLNSPAEWLFSVDYDMVFEPEAPLRLLVDVYRNPEIKIISGTARTGGIPHRPTLHRQKQDGSWQILNMWPSKRLFTVDRVGLFGFLVHRSVFESVSKPWFGGMDECWWFCDKVRESGLKIWADPQVPFSHIGERIVPGTPSEYDEELE